ncbi:hypothetical protein BS78_10G094800 [Paspalum vaginatum]|nr:hypothetical protein BS78_10G094800 [Paspalum vaginatum]
MGCKGSKHALYLQGGCGAAGPEPRRGSRRRHSVVALRSPALGTLSLDRAAAAVAAATAGLSFDAAAGGGGGGGRAGDGGEGMIMVVVDKKKAGDGDGDGDGAAKLLGPSRSFGGWRPATPPLVPQRRRVLVAPRTPSETPVRDEPPEEINVWELMRGLDDDGEEEEESDDDDKPKKEEEGSRERMARSAPGSPAFDPQLLDAFRKAIDELAPGGDSPLPDSAKRGGGGAGAEAEIATREIPTFPGIVRARVDVFQERIDAKAKRRLATPPPESAGRVVVYLTSLRGVRRTYEDCCSTAAVLRAYGARVDGRDLSMHAGFKDELRAALGGGGRAAPLPQVFADGRHLGGAEEVRRLHEAGELAAALEACCAADAKDAAACAGCGGVRFVPCGACSGSCKVFVEDDEGGAGGGAFRRCPECNENGLVRCPVC